GQRTASYPSGAGVAGAALLVGTATLDPNAATDVYSTTLTGPSTYTVNTVVRNVVFTAVADCLVTAVATYDASIASGSAVGSVQLDLSSSSGGPVGDTAAFSTSTQRYAMTASIAALAGDSVQAKITAIPPPNVTISNLKLLAEAIKR